MSGVFERLVRATRRAEQADQITVALTYVPVPGLTDALLASDHHVLVGSRGVGKTHALRHLGAQLTGRALGIPVHSDLRLTWDDPFPLGEPPPLTTVRAQEIVSAILEDIVAQVTELVTAPDGPATDAAAADMVDELSRAVAVATPQIVPVPDEAWACVARSIDAVATCFSGRRLWLLIDEWESLESEIAGDVASLLTRIAHGCSLLTIKCASVRTASTLRLPGIRLDLDEALSVDRSPSDAEQFAEDLLLRHSGLQSDLDRPAFREMLFGDPEARYTLTLASNGVPRDLLNLAAYAVSEDDNQSISTAGVFRAAEDFYERDKRLMLPPYLETDLVLHWIYEQGDDDGRPRAFNVPNSADSSPLLERLEKIRVLRRVPRGDGENAEPHAARAYRMDLGCYRVLRSRHGVAQEAIQSPAPEGALTPEVIHTFERLLIERHPEETYQAFLAAHAILLEPNASEIHPKLRLGAEHVTDFAIRTHDGRWSLVEIEKPHDRPVTQGNELSSPFTHAFGQVIDWLTWVDENIAYAQRAMPGIVGARGRLIMGCRSQMTRKAEAKVRTFCLHNAAVEWVAFDDLAASARMLYRNMHGIDLPPAD